ncbi:MAG TPA: SRPBCC family protein [Streptosporangiaceae bacterium]|nr:SRPBCC family protein [Streptosporangiaceae bacterium]
MTDRSINHATFVIERSYPATPAKVFAAWASLEAKNIWMDDPDYKSDGTDGELDFRVGGHERFGGVAPDGTPYSFDAVYYDIIPDHRIVYSYEMYSGEERMSVSLTTVEMVPEQDGTKLTYTEHGAFLDGIDKPEAREEGTNWLLDNLGKYLATN